MTVLLPNTELSLRHLENHLSWPTVFSTQPCEREKQFVDLRLPRINMTATLSLVNILQDMGVKKIFHHTASEEETAENRFSGMLISSFEQHRFLDQRIVQHVFIDVNEAGVGADGILGAASDISLTSSDYHSQAILVNVNRPFLFFVWHPATQLVLFTGAVRDAAQL